MRKLGIPPENLDPLRYNGPRFNLTPVTEANRRPAIYDRDYSLFTLWRTKAPTTDGSSEGEIWYLSRFNNIGDAIWLMIATGASGLSISFETDDGAPNVTPNGLGEVQIFGGTGISVTGQGPGNTITISLAAGGIAVDQVNIDFNTAPGTDPVVPTAAGEISILGNTVTNATNLNSPVATHSRAANQFHIDVQLSTAITGAPADPFDAGLCSFDDTQFTVDGNGFVQMAGGPGPASQSFEVDFFTAPGTDPVVPTAGGVVTIQGATVANATNANAPVATHSRAANTYNVEVQVATARTGAPANAFDAGLCSFDDTHFTVDANGFVQLIGGGGAVDSINVDFATGPGTDPVVPDGAGQITVQGATVANATNLNAPVATHSRAANTYNIEVQLAAAVAATPGDAFDAGICSFDNSMFTVDANGFVQLAGGGLAIDEIGVDFNTAPGTDPVTPDGNGLVTVQGSTVANATNANAPVATHSRAANTYNVEVQVATAIASAPGDKFDAGLSSFSSAEFTVDTDGFVELVNPTPVTLGTTNLTFSYVIGTGVFSVTGANGSPLSATNKGYVTLYGKTQGTIVTIELTADQSFIDDNGASEIIGNLFGYTTGVAAAESVPFWVYAVLNDSENAVQFMISRLPGTGVSPASGKIGTPSSAIADLQSDFWSFDNITTTEYDTNPCLMIGSITMTKSAADDWTVNGWGNAIVGIGRFGAFHTYTLSRGQFGAASGKYFKDNGGTAPTFPSKDVYLYSVNPWTHEVTVYVSLQDAAAGAAGAVTAQLVTPYANGPNSTTNFVEYSHATFIDNSAGNTRNTRHADLESGAQQFLFYPDGSSTAMTNDDFDTNDSLFLWAKYWISSNE